MNGSWFSSLTVPLITLTFLFIVPVFIREIDLSHSIQKENERLVNRGCYPSPRAENAKIDVKVIGASQEMCNYLPLLQKLPAALVIRKVKVTKHSSFKGRVLLRTTLCAFSSFGKGKIIAHNLGTKIGLISHIYFGIFCTG